MLRSGSKSPVGFWAIDALGRAGSEGRPWVGGGSGIEDRRGVVLRGEFPLGFSFGGSVVAPGYGLRGVVLGFWAIRCPGFEDRTSIVAFSSVLVPLRVACLTDFLLGRPTEK